jgi:hypothetical protein
MSSQDKQTYDDRLLARYLLADLSPDERERLDEMSIADDEFASCLSAVENDLVDAYVRDELSPADRERFRSSYLSSAKRRQKMEFAEALLGLEKRAPSRAQQTRNVAEPGTGFQAGFGSKRMFPLARWAPLWGFAGAALAMLVVAGFLLRQNFELREQVNQAHEHQKAIDQLTEQLQQQMNDLRRTDAESVNDLGKEKAPQGKQLKTIALLLPPPTRGVGPIATISLPPGTDVAVLLLALESDDFPLYRVSLKDSAGNRVLWHSSDLAAASLGHTKAVSTSFPAGLLKQQTYIAELTGIPAHGAPEVLGSYPFRAVLK